jgi:DNA-binding transcriptional LysR family regulator
MLEKDMKFSLLRDFLAVAERGSLRAAARHLGAAQPSISRSIQELEAQLGAVLFERSAKGVHLTPMGEVFQRRARIIFTELRRAQEELDQMRGEGHGRATFGLSTVPQLALLPGALRPFRQRYPDVRLDLIDTVYPGIEARLKDGTVDCYFGPVPGGVDAALSVELMFDNTRVIVGRKGNPFSQATSLGELVGAEWIATTITHKAEEELEPLFTQRGLPPPRVVMEAHSALTYVTLLAYSDLLMMVPIQWAQAPLFRDVLQTIPLRETLAAPAICLVQRNGLPLTPAAEYFCDMMRRAAHHHLSHPG